MARKSGAKTTGRLKSSMVRQLNSRLFFRTLLTYIGMDILLVALFCCGVFVWAEMRCGTIFTLIEENGLPTAEADVWMDAGDYTVEALDHAPRGLALPDLPLPNQVATGLRTVHLPSIGAIFRFWNPHPGEGAGYTMEFSLDNNAYSITLQLDQGTTVAVFVLRILLLVQLIFLILFPFRNARTISRVLRPLHDLAEAANRLKSLSAMSPEDLNTLTRTLSEINETHLDARVSVPGSRSELQVLAASINAMLDRINNGYSAQMRFVSDASHELRTPIAVIQGYASLLNRWGKDNPETRQEAIDAIQAEVGAMKSLVEQLLFLARGDNDSMRISLEPFSLGEMAAEVVRETTLIDDQHVFSAQVAQSVPVCADLALMKQALRILVDNSIKYTPPGGAITLSVSAEGGRARLSVQDEGQGMDAEAIPHIFDRFYRTDESRTRQTGGTGLGLSIAKWIVERHDGWFEVLSWKNVGTRITIVLPLAEGEAVGVQ